MASLQMPNLAIYNVSVEIRYEDLVNDEDNPHALNAILTGLLPGPTAYGHPNLTSFSIELKHTEGRRDWRWCSVENKILEIPLQKIPQVATLSVKMFTKLEMGGEIVALRELRLLDCKQFDLDSFRELKRCLIIYEAMGHAPLLENRTL